MTCCYEVQFPNGLSLHFVLHPPVNCVVSEDVHDAEVLLEPDENWALPSSLFRGSIEETMEGK